MKRILLIFLTIFVPSAVCSMTMDEALRYGLVQNPELRALRLEEGVAKAQLQKAKLPLISNPTMEGNILEKGKGGGIERTFTDYGISISQEFEIAGQRRFRIEGAEKELSRINFEIKDKERMVAYEVRNGFARALAAKQNEELKKESLKVKGELLDSTRTKFQAGDVSAMEVNIAELELGKARTESLSATREYNESIFSLQEVMGLKPDPNFKVDGEILPYMPEIPDKTRLLQKAFMERPDLKAASIEREKSHVAVGLARREAIPNVTLSAFYQRDELRDTGGISLSVPLPLIDRKEAEKKIARIKAEQSSLKYPNLRRVIEKEIEEAYANLLLSYDEVRIFQGEMLARSLENLGLLNLAFREGKISFFDVRLAQKDALEIQFGHVNALLRAQLSINALMKITGGTLP